MLWISICHFLIRVRELEAGMFGWFMVDFLTNLSYIWPVNVLSLILYSVYMILSNSNGIIFN